MPWTEDQKQAELKRVTEISGFCVGGHALLAEVDPLISVRNLNKSISFGSSAMTRVQEEEGQA